MSLTPEDIKTMKDFFDEFSQKISVDTERKIRGPKVLEETAQTAKIRREIQTSEDNLKMVITKLEKKLLQGFNEVDRGFNQVNKQFNLVHKRFDSVDKVLDDLVEFTTRDLNMRLEDHEMRINLLEQTKPASV